MIPVIDHSGKLLYEQVYEFYRDAILNNHLEDRYRLPSHRSLAKELGISNNTVLRAYEQLVLEGYVKNESRKGLYVVRLEVQHWQVKSSLKKKFPSLKLERKGTSTTIKLTDRIIDEGHFPVKQWRRCTNWALDNIRFQYEENEEDDPLKAQLIKYLYHSRGVIAASDRLITGSGANALFFWLAFVLRKTHSKILFEEPGYARARALFSEFDYDLKTIPVRKNGIDLKELQNKKADLLFLTPSHQYPTGATIPVDNRVKILNWAKKNDAYIIEDDFDCEFRYKTKLMPSLQALDRFDRVIYSGSFSSSLMPSLRVAYLVLPQNFQVQYESFTHLNAVPYIIRKTLAHFMESGFWERHLKRMNKIYERKYDACIKTLNKIPKNKIYFHDTSSGLNILLRINTKLSEKHLIQRALENGIMITPVSQFYHNKANQPKQPELLFEFGNIPETDIEAVVRKLYAAWFP